MKNFKIAWRNLWRKPWRTIITSGSIFFGVIFTAIMTSMQYGSYDSMIDNVVKFYSGYIQIFTEAYHENKTINNTFELEEQLVEIVNNTPEITQYTSRLEYFTLASSEELTRGAMVIGIIPASENKVTNLKKWVAEGNYLSEGDDGVLVAIDLAKYLHIGVGDSLVLYGQGFHGVMAAGIYPVKGILKFPSPELNKQFIYMDLTTAQTFFSAPGKLSSFVLMVEDHYHLTAAMNQLKKKIEPPFVVMSWDELQPELVSMIEADKAGGVFMKAILYMIITFGIFGTILMMISERKRELGVMIAIGMQRHKLGIILFIETFFMGLLGAISGLLASIPLVYYFFKNPIPLTGDAAKTMIEMGIEPYMYFSMHPKVFYTQAIIVFIITMVIALFPIYKAFTLKLISALRA
ncbi:MAG: ABC transporter permease [Marinilabiliales bacterium]|nr:MAG: ABC transporter permease [Marinilabiliales bacterium]